MKIVIVGGGFAGVKTALELGHDERFEVTLIAPHSTFEYHGALYRSGTGRSPLEVVAPFSEIFSNYPRINVVNDYVVELRAQTKEVKGQSGRTYKYEGLVLGLGYEVAYYGIAGVREHAETMYAMHDTIRLRERLIELFKKKAGKDLKAVVIGAGPTGLEIAGGISLFASEYAEGHGLKAPTVHTTLLDRSDRVLPLLLPEASAAAQDRLKQLGVSLKMGVSVQSATSRHVSLMGGEHVPADIIVWTAGSRANSFFERYPDIFSLDSRKRVVVSEFLQANSPDIYVLGDSASTPYSGMAQTAIYDALFVANNLRRQVEGYDPEDYVPKEPHYVVPIGGEWAVLQQGDKITVGTEAWHVRREADKWVLENFLPYQLAQDHWHKGDEKARI